MKLTRQLPTQTRRDAWVEVNLAALEHNVVQLRKSLKIEGDSISSTTPASPTFPASPVIPEKAGIHVTSDLEGSAQSRQLMAILKADAYGHGAVMCIPTLEGSGISMIGVASMDEALQIRQAGTELPILVIGVVPDWSARVAIEQDIQITIFDTARLESLKQMRQLTGKPVRVQVKVDTGMHRIGVDWQQAPEFIRRCQEASHISLEGIFSHLANTADVALTRQQLDRWNQVLSQVDPLPAYVHIANSSGALHYPEAQGNMVRLGMALFGYDPDAPLLSSVSTLKPVMGLKGRIIHLQDVPPGSGVSYGYTYKTPSTSAGKPTRIATLPLGYADGVPRILSNRIYGLLRGYKVPQVGTITMDQMMFDVSGLPESELPQLGETITLIGEEQDASGQSHRITLTDWAKLANTIEYELMCALRVRLPKTYTR